MQPFDHPHPEVARLVDALCCGVCGARRGVGLIVRSVDKPRPMHYHIAVRCLRCGNFARVCYEATQLEPGEVLPEEKPAVGTDEVLDLHEMGLDEFAAAWAKATT